MIALDTLWYATGGAAWGTVTDSFAWTGSATAPIFPGALLPGPFLNTAASFGTTKMGWTLGAGMETQLGNRWSAKIEYLYVDLGDFSETMAIPLNAAFGAGLTTGGSATATRSTHVTDNIVRVGLNYRIF